MINDDPLDQTLSLTELKRINSPTCEHMLEIPRLVPDASTSHRLRILILHTLIHETNQSDLMEVLVLLRAILEPHATRRLSRGQINYVDNHVWPALQQRFQKFAVSNMVPIAFLLDRLRLSPHCRADLLTDASMNDFMQTVLVRGNNEDRMMLHYTLRNAHQSSKAWLTFAYIEEQLQLGQPRAALLVGDLFDNLAGPLLPSQWAWAELAYLLNAVRREKDVLTSLVHLALKLRFDHDMVDHESVAFGLFLRSMVGVLRRNAHLMSGHSAAVTVAMLRRFLMTAFGGHPDRMWSMVMAQRWPTVQLVRICQALLPEFQLGGRRSDCMALIARAATIRNRFLRCYAVDLLKSHFVQSIQAASGHKLTVRNDQIESTDAMFAVPLLDSFAVQQQHCHAIYQPNASMPNARPPPVTLYSFDSTGHDEHTVMLKTVEDEVFMLVRKISAKNVKSDQFDIQPEHIKTLIRYTASQHYNHGITGRWRSVDIEELETLCLQASPYYASAQALTRNICIVELVRKIPFLDIFKILVDDEPQLSIDMLLSRVHILPVASWETLFKLLLNSLTNIYNRNIGSDTLLVSILYLADKLNERNPRWSRMIELHTKLMDIVKHNLHGTYVLIRHFGRYAEDEAYAMQLMTTEIMFDALTKVWTPSDRMVVVEIEVCDHVFKDEFPEECALFRSTRFRAMCLLWKAYKHHLTMFSESVSPVDTAYNPYARLKNRLFCQISQIDIDDGDETNSDLALHMLHCIQAIAIMVSVDRKCCAQLKGLLVDTHCTPAVAAIVTFLVASTADTNDLLVLMGATTTPGTCRNVIMAMMFFSIRKNNHRPAFNADVVNDATVKLLATSMQWFSMCLDKNTQTFAQIALHHIFNCRTNLRVLPEFSNLSAIIDQLLVDNTLKTYELDLRFAFINAFIMSPVCWLYDVPIIYGVRSLDVQPVCLIVEHMVQLHSYSIAANKIGPFQMISPPRPEFNMTAVVAPAGDFASMFPHHGHLTGPVKWLEPKPEIHLVMTRTERKNLLNLLTTPEVSLTALNLIGSALQVNDEEVLKDEEVLEWSKYAKHWITFNDIVKIEQLSAYLALKRTEGYQIIVVEYPIQFKQTIKKRMILNKIRFTHKVVMVYSTNLTILKSDLMHYVAVLPAKLAEAVAMNETAKNAVFVWEFANKILKEMSRLPHFKLWKQLQMLR